MLNGDYRNLVWNPVPVASGAEWETGAVYSTVEIMEEDGVSFLRVQSATNSERYQRITTSFTEVDLAAGSAVAVRFVARCEADSRVSIYIDGSFENEGLATDIDPSGEWVEYTGVLNITEDVVTDLRFRVWIETIDSPFDIRNIQVIPTQTVDEAGQLLALPFWTGDSETVSIPDIVRTYEWEGEANNSSSVMNVKNSTGSFGTLGVRLMINDAEVPCHSDDGDTETYALSGLSVTWGRGGITDTPAPSTATFDLADPPGGTDYRSTVRVGDKVDILAVGGVYGDPTVPVNNDPELSTETGWGNPVSVSEFPYNLEFTWETNPSAGGDVITFSMPGYEQTTEAAGGGKVESVFQITPMHPWGDGNYGHRPPLWSEFPHSGSAGEEWTWEIGYYFMDEHRDEKITLGIAWQRPSADNVINDSDITVLDDWSDVAVGGDPQTAATATFTSAAPAAGLFPVPIWRMTEIEPDNAFNPFAIIGIAITRMRLYPPEGWRLVEGTVFSGKVTDIQVKPPADGDTEPTINVQAVDRASDLSQAKTGDDPWPEEAANTRFARVGSGIVNAITSENVSLFYDPKAPTYDLVTRDVDSTDWWSLAQEVATSIGAVLWPSYAYGRGFIVWLESPDSRVVVPFKTLARSSENDLLILTEDFDPTELDVYTTLIESCDVEREPIQWEQDTGELYTRVNVEWQTVTEDDDGNLTEETNTVAVRNSASEGSFGIRALDVQTGLADASSATELAQGWLSRTSDLMWRASGLQITDSTDLSSGGGDSTKLLMPLLDAPQRVARSIMLTDLPDWSPTSTSALQLYLEGGTYAFVDGVWELSMNVSTSIGISDSGVTWGDLDDTWTGLDFDPSVRWLDMSNVKLESD